LRWVHDSWSVLDTVTDVSLPKAFAFTRPQRDNPAGNLVAVAAHLRVAVFDAFFDYLRRASLGDLVQRVYATGSLSSDKKVFALVRIVATRVGACPMVERV